MWYTAAVVVFSAAGCADVYLYAEVYDEEAEAAVHVGVGVEGHSVGECSDVEAIFWAVAASAYKLDAVGTDEYGVS